MSESIHLELINYNTDPNNFLANAISPGDFVLFDSIRSFVKDHVAKKPLIEFDNESKMYKRTVTLRASGLSGITSLLAEWANTVLTSDSVDKQKFLAVKETCECSLVFNVSIDGVYNAHLEPGMIIAIKDQYPENFERIIIKKIKENMKKHEQ